MIKVFVGYDSRVPVLHHITTNSLMRHATAPVAVTPIVLDHLKGVFTRERNPLQSTEFSFSRFLVPYLCDFQGWALFVDNDVLFRDDIAKLWTLRDERYAVQCVKHVYEVKEETKFLGEKQTKYEKKNWSSVLLFNCARCRVLTPDYVNTATGLQLHQFKWVASEDEIGELPKEWNYLVGVYPKSPAASLVHFTDGGPYYDAYRTVDYADEWLDELKRINTWTRG
ncbi:MAG: glycosyltransferase [Limisphaerales bacterium]